MSNLSIAPDFPFRRIRMLAILFLAKQPQHGSRSFPTNAFLLSPQRSKTLPIGYELWGIGLPRWSFFVLKGEDIITLFSGKMYGTSSKIVRLEDKLI